MNPRDYSLWGEAFGRPVAPTEGNLKKDAGKKVVLEGSSSELKSKK